jgi:hypothetical protein
MFPIHQTIYSNQPAGDNQQLPYKANLGIQISGKPSRTKGAVRTKKGNGGDKSDCGDHISEDDIQVLLTLKYTPFIHARSLTPSSTGEQASPHMSNFACKGADFKNRFPRESNNQQPKLQQNYIGKKKVNRDVYL